MPNDAHDKQTEADLLERYANGDAAAARELTALLTPRVYAHAMRMLHNTAESEDVTQEALLRLWRAAPNWRAGEARISTWLYRVTANLCTDRLRRRPTTALDTVPEPTDTAPGAETRLQDDARAQALRAALDQLPLRQRQAVVLRHIDGLANPEIATILNISPRAVESLTARGKRALTALLAGRRADLGYDDDQ